MNGQQIIKVCGMCYGDNIRAVEALGVDMIGLIFYPHSPRAVARVPEYLPCAAKRVGVFVNETADRIMELAREYALDYVQLHGDESVEFCREVRGKGLRLIKNFAVAGSGDLAAAGAYEGTCDMFLFDTKCDSRGGSGRQFDWNVLHAYRGETPFLLSGGIDAGSVSRLREFSHPRLAGFDLNSRFETAPGVKDAALIGEFIKKLKL